MKSSSRRRWTKGEKWLFGAPLLVGVFALAMQFGPELVRKKMGLPRELKTFPNYHLYYVVASSNGSTLAASGRDNLGSQHAGTLLFWDARTLRSRPSWDTSAGSAKPGAGTVRSLALSPDGKTICGNWNTSLFSAYDLQTRKRKWATRFYPSMSAARFCGDGHLLVVSHAGSAGKSVVYCVLNASTGRLVSQWQAVLDDDLDDASFDFSSDGRFVVSVGSRRGSPYPDQINGLGRDGRNIEIHDAQSGRLVRRINCPRTKSARFSPDASQVVVVADSAQPVSGGSEGEQIRCFDRKSGALSWSYGAPRGNFWNTALFSPDGITVAAYRFNQPQRVLLLDAQTGTLKRTLKAQEIGDAMTNPDSLAFSPDSKRLFARSNDVVLVWDLD